MLNDDAETRYRKLAQKQPTVIQYVPQNNIAQYLGITQYTLSRIRGKVDFCYLAKFQRERLSSFGVNLN